MKKKILVIEDDNILQQAVSMALADEGYEVLHALDGDIGIDMAKKEKPDLILLDIILPKKNGLEVLSAIRGDKKTINLPVIIFTVLQQDIMLDKCKALGIQGYFFKSIYSLKDIMKEIDKILKK